MRCKALALGLTLALLTHTAFAAPIAFRVWAQLVRIDPPPDFAKGYEDVVGDFQIIEFAPKGETVEAWSQLFTVTGTRDGANPISVLAEANRLGSNYLSACPDSFKMIRLPAPQIKGATGSFSAYLGCGDVGGQSEAMVFVAIRGASGIFSVQWAERGLGKEATLHPDMKIWNERARRIYASALCPVVPGEAAPYPSCSE